MGLDDLIGDLQNRHCGEALFRSNVLFYPVFATFLCMAILVAPPETTYF